MNFNIFLKPHKFLFFFLPVFFVYYTQHCLDFAKRQNGSSTFVWYIYLMILFTISTHLIWFIKLVIPFSGYFQVNFFSKMSTLFSTFLVWIPSINCIQIIILIKPGLTIYREENLFLVWFIMTSYTVKELKLYI